MDSAALWQRYQDWLYYHEGLDFYLDVSRMGFDDAFVEAMGPKFDKAFQDMDALEGGAIANPDENRMVGHYWLRDPNLAPTPELRQDIIDTLAQIETFTAQVHSGEVHPPASAKFTDVLSIGIGGSALGPQFVKEAISPIFPPLAIHFIDNTDPTGIDNILAKLKDRLSSTLVLVISKSGGTPETRNGMIEVQKAYEAENLDFAPHFVAITGQDSNLDLRAKAEGWLASFPMYDWVGGRTSELSAVGLLPAALQGIDIRQMLAGAKEMDGATRTPEIKKNPAALLCLSWYFACKGKAEKDMVILPYKDSLLLFSRYLQQLVMESIGKEKDLDGNTVYQGIAVYGNKGSTDQHAYVQQLREGVPNFFATFIEVLEDREGISPEVEAGVTSGDYLSGLLQGTREALYENNRDSITVTIRQVNPYTVGALIALYERAVGFYASLVNINAYHQPGVEAGKKAAAAILDLQTRSLLVLREAGKPLSVSELAEKVGASEQVEAIYKIMRHLQVNQRGVILEGNLGQPSSLMVSVTGDGQGA
ncbi:glucose-6-phosphate isomerase [Limnofasciculus baicalensis]|uniref:Glucose-6-phosphate isomerase n=1 Tax=Limnofasciculus baicalensis BBK-W-15 TaxID=2699891 RepID=A0AAE3KQX3_9CYAN|nr:glucose-6-phosphate isomerase [Limnofasciculus baicalensis]MCP2732301.1 glucose-6-phosphate isomerase [Limnofasciculus baicalensis BBK-W-15]